MLDVRRLRVLQQLASHGTVAATAEALHLTAPAVSQQLAVLEREAGLPVVERSGRTLRLTAAGELLLAHAEVVLGDLSAAESDLAACAAAGFVPAIRARSSDFAVLAALVAAGAGVALVPRLGLSGPVPGPAADGGLPVSLHPLVHPVVRTIFTASRTGTARRPDIRRLIELLHDAASAFDA
jgi:DNA-binding transcriptional LysR family regulator